MTTLTQKRRVKAAVVFCILFMIFTGTTSLFDKASAATMPACKTFVSASAMGPLAPGTCRLVKTTWWYDKWHPLWGKREVIKFGNRDTVRLAAASRRGAKEIIGVTCASIALKSPPAGVACGAIIATYWYAMDDTFKSAAASGKCVYWRANGMLPGTYYPITC